MGLCELSWIRLATIGARDIRTDRGTDGQSAYGYRTPHSFNNTPSNAFTIKPSSNKMVIKFEF